MYICLFWSDSITVMYGPLSVLVDIFNIMFFFKQKTVYELLISDWSSDVCSSDLQRIAAAREQACLIGRQIAARGAAEFDRARDRARAERPRATAARDPHHRQPIGNQRVERDRKSTRLNSSH